VAKSFNMSEVQGGGTFEPLPRNRYNVKSIEAERATSGSGNEMLKVTFEIFGEHYEGRKLWDNFVWSETSMWKTKSALEAGESALAEDVNLTIERLEAELNRGISFNTLVTVESYKTKDGENKQRNVMKDFKPIPDGTKVPAGGGTGVFK